MFHETKKKSCVAKKERLKLNSIKSERKVYNKIENLCFFSAAQGILFSFFFPSFEIIKKAF
jgi:hypothetical protein